ncbi:kinase-like protein [Moesziomyces antarcticus]|uniref:Related to CHK1 - Serine/threonine kinase n=1 Tax=Pseudozyma antarctica TaxID=84753 RepID=A0A5C3FH50_PSEA2|nr:kinase-like protein [Moesziomyces antarcticus]GAK62976.1 kinase-like protein [Moesziomyces antarcticus]SPO43540.1 related to CHK1 - Serine/threonine kinase [Moesziomyces antarcticus]
MKPSHGMHLDPKHASHNRCSSDQRAGCQREGLHLVALWSREIPRVAHGRCVTCILHRQLADGLDDMSNVKQSQPTRHKLTKPVPSAPSTRSMGRNNQRDPIDADHSVQVRRPLGPAPTASRSVSSRIDSKCIGTTKSIHRALAPPSRLQPPQSTSILKRSLSKLRIRDPTSPDSRHKSPQTNRSVQQVASKIPQATAPTSTFSRVIRGHPAQSAFVVHDLPLSQSKLQSNRPQQYASTAAAPPQKLPQRASPSHSTTSSSPYKADEVRMKAMQLGIFKIAEADLKDRYKFLNEIGAGEWGSVWTVEALRPLDHLPSSAYRSLQAVKLTGSGTYTIDNTPNFRPLAVKLCERERKYSAAARTQRLWNEFKVLRTLMDQLPRAEQVDASSPNCRVRNDRTGWHPNVVNFYEFLLTPSLAMLVMPKFDEPMKVCLGDALCRKYFHQLLSAVHWLHHHGVCHNDIKVDNLGVTYDTSGLGRDTVTLFDFGFANRYDPAKEGAFMSKEVWGTPEYLAPERFHALLHDERKTDVWALGIAFFEMLTGRTPFEHHDEKFDSKEKYQEYYARADRGTWLGQWDLAPDMEDLIRKMLRHDPKERIDAGGALLQGQFDRRESCDSLDELLQLSYEYSHMQRVTECKGLDSDPVASEAFPDDSDVMLHELVAETERLRLPHGASSDAPSQFASPGVSRAVAARRESAAPASPSLSQVGMDSRLTDLMCVSPPWRGQPPPRQGTPIPSAHRQHMLADSLTAQAVDEQDESDASSSHSSPANIRVASKASSVKAAVPTAVRKESPFRLRVGRGLPGSKVPHSNDGHSVVAPLEAPTAPTSRSKCLPSPQKGVATTKQPARSDVATRGNMVASLAKKFDASNFLARPPPHATAMAGQSGLGLSVGGQLPRVGPGHRRSKSYNIASSRHGVSRLSVRRSTGSIAHAHAHIDAGEMEHPMPECARRLFDTNNSAVDVVEPKHAVEADNATDIGSARSDTKDAGGTDFADGGVEQGVRTPALHAALCGQPSTQLRSISTRPVSMGTSSPGEEAIFRRLKKMASLAGMLTKMIDETKSTILSPDRGGVLAEETPVRVRPSSGTSTMTGVDISPGLLATPPASQGSKETTEEEEADASLVSAAFSMDLSSSQRHTSPAGGTPSAAQVESMYASFLASQQISKSGEGFLSPQVQTSSVGRSKHRSLAALFAPSPALERGAEPPSPTTQRNRSAGRTGKLARLFRMH